MNCTTCHYNYEPTAQYCAQCGNKTVYNPTVNAPNKNVTAVWVYVAAMLALQLMWKFVSLLLVPRLMREGNYANIGDIYTAVGVIALLFELVTFGIIIAIVRNTSARIAVGVYAGATLLLFLLDRLLVAAHLY